jgi:hypothetical protein
MRRYEKLQPLVALLEQQRLYPERARGRFALRSVRKQYRDAETARAAAVSDRSTAPAWQHEQ